MKKWIVMFLAFAVMLGCYGYFCQPANAAEEEMTYTEGDYTYQVSDGEAAITAYTGSTTGHITIPSTLGGYPVTAIGAGVFYDKGGITGVTIPDGIRTVGNDAFAWCTGLEEVTIPDSVEVIDVNAFSICRSLERVSIGSGVKMIGGGAFGGCDVLEFISIPDSITYVGQDAFPANDSLYHTYGNARYVGNSENPYAVLVKCTAADITSASIHEGTKAIAGAAFHECKGLTEIVIPNGVRSIGDTAFEGCSGLGTISIPDSVLRIGNSAFNWCTALTSVSIGDGVKEIGQYAFNECANLKEVLIGSGVTYMGVDAFGFCYNLSDVYITDLAAWCEMDFAGGGTSGASPLCYAKDLYVNGKLLTDLVIPLEVTQISPGAFNNCVNIESVKIHNGVTYIGQAAFARCTGLKSISIPYVGERKELGTEMYRYPFGYIFGYESYTGSTAASQDVYYIDNSGNIGVSFYTNFYIPDSLEVVTVTGGEIWPTAFQGCGNLTNVTVGAGTTGVGAYAFRYCGNLKTITLSDSVTSIGDGAFQYCGNLSEIMIPDQVTGIGQFAFEECKALTKVTVGDGVTEVGSCAFKNCTALSQVEIGSGLEKINGYAFENCTGLTAVYITNLAGWCQMNFADGNYYGGGQTATPLYYAKNLYLDGKLLEHLVVPEAVTEIAALAFHNCGSLITVHISEGVTAVGDSAFSGCAKLAEVTIADSVISIDSWAFGNCGELAVVTIADGVISIGDSAFYGSGKLTEITIPDSVTAIGGSAFWDCRMLTDVYYIGDPEKWNAISFGSLAFPEVTVHYSYLIGSDGTYYSTMEEALAAVAEGSLLRLGGVLRQDVVIDQSVVLDLNGFDVLGTVTVADGCTLYCLDSQTDDYTIKDEKGYGKLTKLLGNVQGLPETSDLAEDGYLMITEEDGVSFHRVNLQLTAMTLRASVAGVYYKCTFAGDELVAQNVSRFGVALSIKGMPAADNLETQCVLSWFEGFEAGVNGDEKNSTLLSGIMKSRNSDKLNAKYAAMPIYGRAYILMADGQYLFGAAVSRSLQQQVEAADAMWDQLDATQQAELIGMYQRYADVMQNWTLPYLQTEISAPAAILLGKEELAA